MILQSIYLKRVREIIESKGLKHSSVAERAGLSKSAFSSMLNGNGNVTLETLERVAKALQSVSEHLSPLDLLKESHPVSSPHASARQELTQVVREMTEEEAAGLLAILPDHMRARVKISNG